MEILTKKLDALIEQLADKNALREKLSRLVSVFPFSEYEYIIATLLARDHLSFDEYLEIRDEYINRNLFLYVFEISAPRSFGDVWAFGHLCTLEPDLKRPSRKIDGSYTGEYDLYLEWQADGEENIRHIKIEVKASRATDRNRNDEPIYVKALTSSSPSPYLMNFQQLKPTCCDVFLWVAVYRDTVKYWVINSNAVQQNRYLTPQHRNAGTAVREKNYQKETIFEGQIMLTNENAADFDAYLTDGKRLKQAIIAQYKIQQGIK